MADNITDSQVADRGSSIANSKNETNLNSKNETNLNSKNVVFIIKKIRTEAVIISFVVGTLASLLASYVYEHLLK